jgi:hypothetical protein
MRKRSSDGTVKSVNRSEYDLDELLKRITRKNVHEEIQFGNPTGKSTYLSPSRLRATTMRNGGNV